MSGPNWPGAVARRIGLSGLVDFTTTRVGQTLHVPCAKGGHVVDFTITGNMPPDFVAKKMMQHGWTLGSKLACPDCSSRKKKPRAAAPIEQEQETMQTSSTAIAAATAQASPAAGKAKRLVYMALEDYYDEANKRYKPGHSDATIAKDCGGISEAAVKAIREESYGPLGEPIDVSEFRDALKDMRSDVTQTVEGLRNKIVVLERRLEALVRKNGWAE